MTEHPVMTEDGSAHTAARIALLALRASAPTKVALAPDRVRIGSGGDVLTDDEAAYRLAAMQNPLECTSTGEDRTLTIACGPLSSDALRVILSHRERFGGIRVDPVTYEKIPLTARDRVRIEGSEEDTIVASGADLRRYLGEYWIEQAHGYAGDLPNAADRDLGIAWVFRCC